MSTVIDRTTGLNVFEQTNCEPAMATASNTRACAGSPTVSHTYSCTTLRMSEPNTPEAHVLRASFHKAHELKANTHEHNFFTHNTFSCTKTTPYTGNRGTGVCGR